MSRFLIITIRLAARTAAAFCLCVVARAQWTVVNLHPGGADSSQSWGVSAGQQVGDSSFGGGPYRASLWLGTSASWLNLNPSGASISECHGVSGGQQVGFANVGASSHASLWSGTASSRVDLNPTASPFSYAYGVGGGQQVGEAYVGGNYHASLWSGNASSWVDLNPAGASRSTATGVSGGKQVGYAFFDGNPHASLWSGTAASWVDLNPPGSSYSEASGVNGQQQAGFAIFGDNPHAILWTGTAASWLDINPPGATQSQAWGVHGGQQVGNCVVGNIGRAHLWSGSAASSVDLHAFLPDGFHDSEALGISHDGGNTYVVGYGVSSSTGQPQALMWVVPNNLALFQEFIVNSGKRVYGGLRELSNSDNTYFKVNPLQSKGGRRLNTELVVGANVAINSPITMTVKVESHVSPSPANCDIALRNWSTGEFVTIRSFVATTVDSLQTISGILASPYERADGRIEVRMKSVGAGQNSIDMVRIELSP